MKKYETKSSKFIKDKLNLKVVGILRKYDWDMHCSDRNHPLDWYQQAQVYLTYLTKFVPWPWALLPSFVANK